MDNMPRLKKEYRERIMDALTKEYGYKNVMQVPKLEKIVIFHQPFVYRPATVKPSKRS